MTTTTTHTPTPLVRLPRKFVDDHFERALATPEYVKASATHCWVRPDDPAIPELLDDARYYADQYGPDAPWLKPGARAVVAALTKARNSA